MIELTIKELCNVINISCIVEDSVLKVHYQARYELYHEQ